LALLTPETPGSITSRVVNDYKNAYEPMGQALMLEIFDMHQTQQDLLPKLGYKLWAINVDYQPTNEGPLKRFCKNGYEVLHMKGTSHFPMIENPMELNKNLELVVHEIKERQ
jgi:hypothetical protein